MTCYPFCVDSCCHGKKDIKKIRNRESVNVLNTTEYEIRSVTDNKVCSVFYLAK